MNSRALSIVGRLCCGFIVAACSSGPESSGVALGAAGSAGGAALGSAGSIGEPSLIGASGASAGTASTSGGADASCAASEALAELTPLNLILMYDRSGSMGDVSSGFDPALRWNPVNAGMTAFFTDPGSHGMAASLAFFPVDGDLATACSGPYDSPTVPLTSLASSAPLVAALTGTKPHGGTPTLPALDGALRYATQVQKTAPQSRTVVVLVSDGEPGFLVNGQVGPGCANNDIAHVVALAKSAQMQTPPLPTYVIGVGPSLDALNAIAAAGGTGKANLVSATNPSQTTKDIQNALSAIRTLQLSCDVALPAPPDGARLDIDSVNVRLTTSAEGDRLLGYNADCTGGTGWHYDSRAAPTKIELCATTCAKGQDDPKAKIALLFGCATVVNVQ